MNFVISVIRVVRPAIQGQNLNFNKIPTFADVIFLLPNQTAKDNA
jgi:hypothetical protein